jgi:hypothetical protein
VPDLPPTKESGSSFTLRDDLDAAVAIAERLSESDPWSIDKTTLLAHLHVLQEDWPEHRPE